MRFPRIFDEGVEWFVNPEGLGSDEPQDQDVEADSETLEIDPEKEHPA